jgi:hypothetical protein
LGAGQCPYAASYFIAIGIQQNKQRGQAAGGWWQSK